MLINILAQIMPVGRGLAPADRVTKYTRLDAWNNVMFFGIFPVVFWEIISFNIPIKNRSRVGGVKTPPYEIRR